MNKDKPEEEEKKEEETASKHDVEQIKKEYAELIKPLKGDKANLLHPEEFEKDNDENYHVDYISALSACRCLNY